MPTPPPLEDIVGFWRTEIDQVDITSARGLSTNASAYGGNLLDLVRPTPAIRQALETAILASRRLATAAASSFDKPSREEALAALDALERALAEARPSDRARSSGQDW